MDITGFDVHRRGCAARNFARGEKILRERPPKRDQAAIGEPEAED